jgi:CHAD domain-containing protein
MVRLSITDQLARSADVARHASSLDLPIAIHDVRKALRRVRAVVDLCNGALPDRKRRRVLAALRKARHSLGIARDHSVAPEVLSRIPLDAEDRDSVRIAIEAALAMAPPAAEIRDTVTAAAEVVAAQVEILQAALPAELDWATLVEGARATYRDARASRKTAKKSKRAYHAWRRRTKELAYQLDVLAAIDPVGVAEVRREIDQASDAQGPVVDVIMVRELVRRHAPDIEHRNRLRDALDSKLAPMMKETRKAARATFRTKSRAFGRRLEARAG